MDIKKVKHVVIHCSDSPFGNAMLINKWHTDSKPQGRGWRAIGYHFVIMNGFPTTHHKKNRVKWDVLDGNIEYGRPLDSDPYIGKNERGAHVYGFNSESIGVCLVGRNKFTRRQLVSLRHLVVTLLQHFDLTTQAVVGHYELNEGKTCPNMGMSLIRQYMGSGNETDLKAVLATF